jgi:hypothetical protein
LAFIIWTDIETGQTPEKTSTGGFGLPDSAGKVRIYGKNLAEDGRAVEWQCETGDGKTGSIRIDGARYDLTGGPLFLVSTKGAKGRVRQLRLDLSGSIMGEGVVHSLAAQDREVVQFVADASKQK